MENLPQTSSQIKVSVVIPVKNGEKFIEECLESILKQRDPPKFEVSIYNDGSTDETLQIIEKMLPKFQELNIPVILGHGDVSGGVGYAKNRACLQSTGEFLCFLDSDDVMEVDRLKLQYEAALSTENNGQYAFVGSQFTRKPEGSTGRYARWACNLSNDELQNQIYTSFGPTLIAPTWFISRKLFDEVGGFNEQHLTGYPEDLEFFYKALSLAQLRKVAKPLVMYRWHPGCATFIVDEKTIFKLRIEELQRNILENWETITIWNAGKHGRRFYKFLHPENQKKVIAFCDVSERKIRQGFYEIYDETNRKVQARIPIIHHKDAKPPTVLCVKLDMTDGQFEEYLAQKNWKESVDYVHFS